MLQLAAPHENILKYERLLIDPRDEVHMLFEFGGESLIDFISKRAVILKNPADGTSVPMNEKSL